MMVAASSAAATPCAVVMGRPKAGWLFHANQYTDEISVLLAEPGKHDLLIALLILLCRFHGVAARLVRSGFRGVVTPRRGNTTYRHSNVSCCSAARLLRRAV